MALTQPTDTELVEAVLVAFAQALATELGPDDDFFGLGGDSLAGMVVVAELQASLGVTLSPAAVGAFPTPRLLAGAIAQGDVVEPDDDLSAAGAPAARPSDAAGRGRVPLWPVQEGQIMLAPHDAGRGFLSWAVQYNGDLDVAALAGAVDEVVERFEVLRTRIGRDEHGWYQEATPFTPGVLQVVDLRDRPKPEAIDAAVAALRDTYRSLSLHDDPRFRATLYQVGTKANVVGMFVSDALVDGESGNLLAAEIARAYAVRAGQPVPEAPRASDASYLAHVAAHPVAPATAARVAAHWTDQVRRVPTELAWPQADGDPEQAAGPGPDGLVTAGFELHMPRWHQVLAAARALRTTPYVVLLSGLQLAVARVLGAGHVLVTSVATDRRDPATEGMIGCFNSIVRIEGRVEPGDAVADVTARTAAAVLDAVAHCAVPAPLAIAQADPEAGAVAPPTTGVHLYLWDRRESPVLPGLRRRRFRLNATSRESLRLNCTQAADGSQSFFLLSDRAPQPVLDELAAVLHEVLEGVADRHGSGAAT